MTKIDTQPVNLVVGLIAALGTPNRDIVISAIEFFCQSHKFEFQKVKISAQWTLTSSEKQKTKDYIKSLDEKIKLGDKYRKENGNDSCLQKTLEDKTSKENTILVIDQLKHENEWSYLTKKYGKEKTILLGLFSSEENRRSNLKRQSTKKSSTNMALLEELLIKDQYGYKEIGEHSQQVGKFFKEAHAFVDMDVSVHSIELQVKRIFELLYGNNITHSPTRDEYAMSLAKIASYRSSELGRQVGAVISTPEGDVLAVAPNEVSHYPGEIYFDTIDGPPQKDNREKSGEKDYGKAKLNSIKLLFKSEKEYSPQKEWIENLIEFIRATHAEEQAICMAAKLGIAIKNGLLYSTTFPCHHCTRKIISSGIKEVIFIEPYPKSLAMEMFNSQVTYNRFENKDKVCFRPLIGIAPKLYSTVFQIRGDKHNEDGTIKKWHKAQLIL